jgi:benzoyl-CoA reductase subunit A
MKCSVGIDLGSTTTKAVVLDEGGAILGRGITREEAFITARFGLLRQNVEEAAGPHLLDRLLKAFRLSQNLAQLDRLRAEVADEIDRSVADHLTSTAHEAVAGIFEASEAEEEAWFADDEIADPDSVSFDLLVGLYDKCIIRVENEPLELGFRHHIASALERIGDPAEVHSAVEAARDAKLEEVATVGTGYGRARLPFPKEQIRSEILCHGLGAHILFPGTRTVLDIGGQDTKAIQVNADGIVTSFQMNDRCAAGCGRYLGYIADEMNIGLHELGPLAQKSTRHVKINSTCTVFAGAELRERLSLGESREDIVAGLHRAIILRAMSLLARSGGIDEEFTFTGGVARNPAAVKALHGLCEETYGERTLNISPDSIFTGALGAAVFSHREARA